MAQATALVYVENPYKWCLRAERFGMTVGIALCKSEHEARLRRAVFESFHVDANITIETLEDKEWVVVDESN